MGAHGWTFAGRGVKADHSARMSTRHPAEAESRRAMTHVEDTEALRAEIERLREQNAKLQRSRTRRERARRASVVALLVLGCGLAALSVVAIWLRVTLLDTDRYVSTVAPIAAQPAVQKAVADKLDGAINSRVDFDGLAREALPDRADVLAPAIQTRPAVVHPHPDRRLHAVAALPGPVGRGQPARAHADRRAARGRALEAARARRGHGLPRPLAGRRPRQDRAAGTRAEPDRERDPAERRRAHRARAVQRARPGPARRPVVEGGRDRAAAARAAVPRRLGLALAPAPARAAARGDRRRAGDAAADRRARRSPAPPTSTRSAAAHCRATPPRTSSTRWPTFLRNGVRIVVIVAVVLALVSFLAGMPLAKFASAALVAAGDGSRRRWVARSPQPADDRRRRARRHRAAGPRRSRRRRT